MRKQEYIHVHALLVEVAHHLIDRDELSTEVFDDYKALDTRSMSVHESKEAHSEAITVLATAIETSLESAVDDAPDIRVR